MCVGRAGTALLAFACSTLVSCSGRQFSNETFWVEITETEMGAILQGQTMEGAAVVLRQRGYEVQVRPAGVEVGMRWERIPAEKRPIQADLQLMAARNMPLFQGEALMVVVNDRGRVERVFNRYFSRVWSP